MGIHTGTQSNQWGQMNYTWLGSPNSQGCQHGNIQGACIHCAYGYQQYSEPMRAYAEYCQRTQQPQPSQEKPILEKEVKGERVDNQVKRLEKK